MEYSDYARKRLNGLINKYLLPPFLAITILAAGDIAGIVPVNWIVAYVFGTMITFLFFWIFERRPILAKNKADALNKQAIEDYYMHITSVGIEAKEQWLDKKITSIRFASNEEKMGTKENSFYYDIFLDNKSCGFDISKKMKMDCFFRPASGKIMKIDGIDCLALLPYRNKAETLLVKIFDFAVNQRYKIIANGLPKKTDHTLKALENTCKNIVRYTSNVLSENYKDTLEIFLSGEEFEVAGIEIEGSNNKKMFLLTAIKTGNGEVVLFPTKTIVDIFNRLDM